MADLDAKHYQANSKIQYGLAKELVINHPFQCDKAILDIGCGDGKITAEIARNAPDAVVIGVDLSPNMIAHAQKTYPPSRYPNLQFIQEDAENIELKEYSRGRLPCYVSMPSHLHELFLDLCVQSARILNQGMGDSFSLPYSMLGIKAAVHAQKT